MSRAQGRNADLVGWDGKPYGIMQLDAGYPVAVWTYDPDGTGHLVERTHDETFDEVVARYRGQATLF